MSEVPLRLKLSGVRKLIEKRNDWVTHYLVKSVRLAASFKMVLETKRDGLYQSLKRIQAIVFVGDSYLLSPALLSYIFNQIKMGVPTISVALADYGKPVQTRLCLPMLLANN
jgi:hypothetical protein